MDSQEEVRSRKQSYLRETILEPGYDAENFINYLDGRKKGGTDIDNWSLDELKTEVTNYKQKYSDQGKLLQEHSCDKSPSTGNDQTESFDDEEFVTEPKEEHAKTEGDSKENRNLNVNEAINKSLEDDLVKRRFSEYVSTKKPMSNVDGKLRGTIAKYMLLYYN